jgi:hypothetical protein
MLTAIKARVDELIEKYNRKYSINEFHTLDSLNEFLDGIIKDLKQIKELL